MQCGNTGPEPGLGVQGCAHVWPMKFGKKPWLAAAYHFSALLASLIIFSTRAARSARNALMLTTLAPWLIRFFEQAKRESSPVDQIQFFSTDKGGEFFNKILKEYFDQNGVQHQTAPAHTSRYNAMAERANRTIGEMAEALRIYAGLSGSFWGYSRKHAAFL